MSLERVKQHKGALIVFLSVLILSTLSYVTGSPLKFVLGFVGLMGIVYYSKELREDFNVPIIFKRDGKNKWGGRFGGLTGGLTAAYGSHYGYNSFSSGSIEAMIAEFSLNIALTLILLTLGAILITGSILQDVRDGYIDVS